MTTTDDETYDDSLCDACQLRPRGHGHWAMYCQLCSELAYGLYVDALGHVRPLPEFRAPR